MTQEVKVKRRLKDIDFSREDSHIALVHKDQGGPASGANYKLVLKALNKESEPVVKSTVDDTSLEVKEGVSNPVVKQVNKEKQMEDNEKFEALQKSMNEQAVQLQKALEQVKALESEKKEQVVKSKTAKISEIVKDEAHAKIIAKASLELESEDDFTAFVAAISAMRTVVDNSEMFVEKGLRVPDTESKTEVNHVEKLLKAKYAAK